MFVLLVICSHNTWSYSPPIVRCGYAWCVQGRVIFQIAQLSNLVSLVCGRWKEVEPFYSSSGVSWCMGQPLQATVKGHSIWNWSICHQYAQLRSNMKSSGINITIIYQWLIRHNYKCLKYIESLILTKIFWSRYWYLLDTCRYKYLADTA